MEGIIAYVMASTGIAFSDIIVTMDEMDMSRNGIKHRTIWDFLTADKWN